MFQLGELAVEENMEMSNVGDQAFDDDEYDVVVDDISSENQSHPPENIQNDTGMAPKYQKEEIEKLMELADEDLNDELSFSDS